jgi:hypothetical protein
MIKKLIATGVLAGALALGAAGVATAGTVGSTFTLAPGTQACVNTSSPAYSSVRAEGQVMSGHPVRFTLSASGPYVYGTLDDTGGAFSVWAAQHTSFSQPTLFPSNFRACAINQSQKSSTVNLLLTGN